MPDTVPNLAETVLEVVSPDGARRYVRVTQMPFLIGRGAETGNHLQLADRRISRNCAAIVTEASKFYIEDRGQRRGLFVNGEKVESRELQDGDSITFGLDDSYEIIYRSAANASTDSLPHLLTRIEHITSSEPGSGGLRKLNLLLEATTLLHSQLPLDTVLGHMLDHAVSVTDADRGLLLEADDKGVLKVRLARRSGGMRLRPKVSRQSDGHSAGAAPTIRGDHRRSAQLDMDLQAAQSIVAQRLRPVVVIPLYAMSRANTDQSMINIKRGDFLGVLLDSRRRFLQTRRRNPRRPGRRRRQLLDNARLVERERERQRLEQESASRATSASALAEKVSGTTRHLSVSGINFPCLAVGGDYFDVFPLGGVALHSCSPMSGVKDSARPFLFREFVDLFRA